MKTLMSPDIVEAAAWTFALAVAMLHGEFELHWVPEPVGDT